MILNKLFDVLDCLNFVA